MRSPYYQHPDPRLGDGENKKLAVWIAWSSPIVVATVLHPPWLQSLCPNNPAALVRRASLSLSLAPSLPPSLFLSLSVFLAPIIPSIPGDFCPGEVVYREVDAVRAPSLRRCFPVELGMCGETSFFFLPPIHSRPGTVARIQTATPRIVQYP